VADDVVLLTKNGSTEQARRRVEPPYRLLQNYQNVLPNVPVSDFVLERKSH